MSKPKHTPGPWDYSQSNLEDCAYVEINGIAWQPNKESVTDDANARLIAAAPELLEAARFLVERADEISDRDAKEYGPLIANAIHRLCNAVSKAEGCDE